MKLFRFFVRSTALLAVFATCAAIGDPQASAAKFRAELAARVQEFGKLGAAAVPGVDHWLFLVSELRFLSCDTFWGAAAPKVSRAKADAADPLPAIIDFQQQLKARGIELLLVPVPPKAAIYPEKLMADAVNDETAAVAPLKRFYEELKTAGVDVLDLSPIFAAERDGKDPLFCRTDTHWSGAGCVLAAKAIAERVRAKLGETPGASAYAGTWNESELTGDLIGLLPPGANKPLAEKLRLREVVNKETGDAVKADDSSPVLLLGDSHTLVFHEFSGTRSGLLDQMALELGAAPDLIGTRGSGATAVRINLLRKSVKDHSYLDKKKLVVWCFTSREFTESDQGWAKVPISK